MKCAKRASQVTNYSLIPWRIIMKKILISLLALGSISVFATTLFKVGDKVIPDKARNKIAIITSISTDGLVSVSKFGWIRLRIFNPDDLASTEGCLEDLCVGDKVKAPDSKCLSIINGINFSKNTYTIHSFMKTSELINATHDRAACTDFKIGYRRFQRSMLEKY